jgi:hypothetical protein
MATVGNDISPFRVKQPIVMSGEHVVKNTYLARKDVPFINLKSKMPAMHGLTTRPKNIQTPRAYVIIIMRKFIHALKAIKQVIARRAARNSTRAMNDFSRRYFMMNPMNERTRITNSPMTNTKNSPLSFLKA